MTKTYPEQLGEWVKQRESSKRDENTVAFLAVRDKVKAALEAGYSVSTIWKNLREEERIAVSYNTFLKYVNRHIRRARERPADMPKAKPTVARRGKQSAVAAREGGVVRTKPDAISGFTFNSTPKKEDLI